jgi:hypothetical protein
MSAACKCKQPAQQQSSLRHRNKEFVKVCVHRYHPRYNPAFTAERLGYNTEPILPPPTLLCTTRSSQYMQRSVPFDLMPPVVTSSSPCGHQTAEPSSMNTPLRINGFCPPNASLKPNQTLISSRGKHTQRIENMYRQTRRHYPPSPSPRTFCILSQATPSRGGTENVMHIHVCVCVGVVVT